MKKFQTTVGILLLCKLISAQDISTFCISVEGPNYDRNLCGTITYDGNYVAGGIVDLGLDQNNFVAKCNGDGTLLWSHTIGTTFVDDYYGLTETSDHSIIAVGYAGGKLIMTKWNSEGNEQWNKQISALSSNVASDITETTDGNYLITGDIEDLLSGWRYCAVLKISPDGDLVWEKYFHNTYHAEQGYSCIETADHRYVISGYSSAFSNQTFIFSLSEDGVLQWVKKTVDGGVGYDLVATPDSSVILVGYSCNVSDCNPMLMKIDSAGNMQWSYTYGDSLFGRFYAIDILPDGALVMGGDATDQLTVFHGFIVKTDADGQMLWGKINDFTEVRSIGTTPDGKIIMSGTGGGGFGISKVDPDGNGCAECSMTDYGLQGEGTTLTEWDLSEFTTTTSISDFTSSPTELTPVVTLYCSEENVAVNNEAYGRLFISPNPADDYVKLLLPGLEDHWEVMIADAWGRNITTIQSGADAVIRISTRDLPNGIYFLHDSNNHFSSELIVAHH